MFSPVWLIYSTETIISKNLRCYGWSRFFDINFHSNLQLGLSLNKPPPSFSARNPVSQHENSRLQACSDSARKRKKNEHSTFNKEQPHHITFSSVTPNSDSFKTLNFLSNRRTSSSNGAIDLAGDVTRISDSLVLSWADMVVMVTAQAPSRRPARAWEARAWGAKDPAVTWVVLSSVL